MPPEMNSNKGVSPGMPSNDFVNSGDLYNRAPGGQQSMYGNPYVHPQFSGYHQEPYYGFQPYNDYDHSGREQGSYNQQFQYPPAVKGAPTDDARLALLHSQANEAFLVDFYQWNLHDQQGYLDWCFGAVAAPIDKTVALSSQYRPPVGGHEAAVVPRDPAPYTGFSAGNKKEMLFQHLEKVAETSSTGGEPSGSRRTVLHDPIAHHAANQHTCAATVPLLEAQVSNFTPLHNQPPQSAQTQSARYRHDLLESSEALPSAPGAHDSTSPNYDDAPSNSQGSYHNLPFSSRLIDALERIQRPDALDRHFAHIQEVHDMLEARDSPQWGFPYGEQPKTHVIALDPTQSNMATEPTYPNTVIDARHPEGSRQMPQVLHTATGHPIPHGGFADFKTPYNKNFMGTWMDYPEPFASEAARALLSDSILREQSKNPDADLVKKATWFRAYPSAKDIELQAITIELKARSHRIFASNIATGVTAAGTAQPLPKPIGHERAAAANQHAGTTSVTITDLMKNPTAQDGMNLMSGTIANLVGYAKGKDIGGHFANWTRPAEHAIDKSSDGNKSVFDKNWGSPPARVGRDPRYQQTMTTDGRATYFEDPARGMGRQ